MEEQNIKEKEYLINISKVTLPQENPFIIHTENNKVISVISRNTSPMKELDTVSSYRVLYDTVLDLTIKISYALQKAIEDAYSDEVQHKFDMLHTGGSREWSAYYNIENALFRIEALWDILAQIYNIKYSLEKDIKDVYHSRIFSRKEQWVKKYWKSGMPDAIGLIANYFTEEDDTEVTDGAWKGNYSYVNSLRNNMTHKFSISNSELSSYAFELKEHPSYILKRVTECFSQLQSFIYTACKNILAEIKDEKLEKY